MSVATVQCGKTPEDDNRQKHSRKKKKHIQRGQKLPVLWNLIRRGNLSEIVSERCVQVRHDADSYGPPNGVECLGVWQPIGGQSRCDDDGRDSTVREDQEQDNCLITRAVILSIAWYIEEMLIYRRLMNRFLNHTSLLWSVSMMRPQRF